jgi:hypothetical protein
MGRILGERYFYFSSQPETYNHISKIKNWLCWYLLVATGFLDQTRRDGGDYKHTKFSLSYLPSRLGPGHLFLAIWASFQVILTMSSHKLRV